MKLLLELTIHGTLVFLAIGLLDRLFAGTMSARTRRVWWLAVPLAFLVVLPVPIAIFAATPSAGAPAWNPLRLVGRLDASVASSSSQAGLAQALASPPRNSGLLVVVVVAVGAAVSLLVSIARTRSALRRWGRERLSTDAPLLELLEDCKAAAGITAPIGLVVTDAVDAPVILGWLRPRILLPAGLAASLSREQLRGVLLHELAHFRAGDVPVNWVFTVVCAVHWFNPAAHLAFRGWTRFCEEAADEEAVRWLGEPSGLAYGETLLHILRKTCGQPAPFAALAIVESTRQLRNRLTMIKHYPSKSPRPLLTAAVLLLVVVGVFLRPTHAGDTSSDPRAVATGTMKPWLEEIDNGSYAQSWQEASPDFQKAITSEGWVATCAKVRTPLGKCTARTLASALNQTDLPSPRGPVKGDFILAQFEASFEGLKYAVETVTFSKSPDGTWKASGYYVKPK